MPEQQMAPKVNSLIVVVDDDRSTRYLLRQMLERDGYDVIEASNGEDALKLFEEKKPDMLLIDAMMPLMDGITTCSHIRSMPGGQPPILMITSLDDDKIVNMAYECGVTDFITKPIQFAMLRQRVRRVLQNRQTEMLLEKSIINEQSISQLVHDGIIILDNQDLITSFNQAAEFIFNYNANEISGQPVTKLIPELYPSHDAGKDSNQTIKIDEVIKIKREVKGYKKDGSSFPMQVTMSGTSSGTKLLTIHDLNERRQSESKIKMASKVFESINEAIVITDAKGIVQFVNPAFTKISGYSENEIIEKSANLLASGLNTPKLTNAVLKSLEKDHEWRGEAIVKRKSGEAYPVSITIGLIIDKNSGDKQYIAIFHDATEQMRLREKQDMLQKQAVRIQKVTLLSTISAGIIHEINQPLNSIKILADSMIYLNNKRGKTLEMPKVIENLQKISDQIVRIDNIIKNMRAFAGMKHNYDVSHCSLNESIKRAAELLNHQFETAHISYSSDLAEEISDVPGNSNVIEEIVLNLMINAMQALEKTEGKKREISCKSFGENKKVIFEISDNALGISDDIKEKIFDAFFSTKNAEGGMGLGLALVQSIVLSYEGTIEVYNNQKGGATFKLTFPAIAPQ